MSTVRSAALMLGGLISRIEVVVASILLLVMVALVFADVVLRYVFDAPIIGTSEIAGALFVWVLFLGSAAAARRRLHVGVVWFVDQLPAQSATVVRRAATATIVAILLVVGWFGLELMNGSGDRALPLTDIPLRLIYAAVPIGCVLMAIGFVSPSEGPDEVVISEPIG